MQLGTSKESIYYKPLIPLMLPYSPAVIVLIMCHYLLQRWSRTYRDDTCHTAIDTNNGVEAQNKLLKYSYMPKQKSMTLSGIACLLVDQFLPDAHRNYILANVKVTEWYQCYKNFVPEFLRGQPRSVILLCLDRQTKARKYDAKDVTSTTSEGVLKLTKAMEASTLLILDVTQALLHAHVRTGFVGICHANISLLCSIMCQKGIGALFH